MSHVTNYFRMIGVNLQSNKQESQDTTRVLVFFERERWNCYRFPTYVLKHTFQQLVPDPRYPVHSALHRY